MRESYDGWIRRVDEALAKLTMGGMDSRDWIPDCPFLDWYNSGITPSAAVKKAIAAMRRG